MARKYRLSKTNASGIKETYELMSLVFSYKDNAIAGVVRRSYVSASGVPATQDINVYYNESAQSEQLVVDPAWDATSTPPKPEGFSLMDPSTWGSLTIADIPFVTETKCSSKLLTIMGQATSETTLGEAMTRGFIEFLISEGKMPSDWTLEAVELS